MADKQDNKDKPQAKKPAQKKTTPKAKPKPQAQAKPAPVKKQEQSVDVPQLPKPKHHKKGFGIKESFALFVLVPTVIAAIYYLAIAEDIFISTAKITVQTPSPALPIAEAGAASQSSVFSNVLGASESAQDAQIVKAYIESQSMSAYLNDNTNFVALYQSPKGDVLSRLEDSPSKESIYSYYRDRMSISLEPQGHILTLNLRAFDAKDSHRIMSEIIDETERFVNTLSRRIQEDSLRFIQDTVDEAKQALEQANEDLRSFRNTHQNFDPQILSSGIMSVIQGMESELATAQTELDTARRFYQDDSARVASIKAQIDSLSQQIRRQNERLASEHGAELSELLERYTILVAEQEFARQRYEASLQSLEAARLQSQKQQKYLIRIVEPTLPETAEEPRRIYMIFIIFLALSVSYGIGRIIFDAIRDTTRR